jgi:hypothetical protein
MGHSKQNRCVPLQISRWGHAAISKLTKLQTRIEDEDDDEYEHDLRRTQNAEPDRQTRLTRLPNRILYRLAGLVSELLFSAPRFTWVVVPPP